MPRNTVRTICFECHSRCGVLLTVAEGKLVGIRGDKNHPFSHGYTCPKGRACMEMVYHKDRIVKPLIRNGERGSGSFREATWEEALDRIAEQLLDIREKYGAESIVFGSGTTRGLAPYLSRFLSCLGSPNFMAPSNMSGGPIVVGSAATCGFGLTDPDYAQSECILLWAHNPAYSWPGLYLHDIRQGLKKGARLIVVDPRKTGFAAKADHWLQIRPGTDVALALCFIHLLIEKGLYDKSFVEEWTTGFDQLRAYVAEFTPQKTAEITWLDPQEIEDAVSAFGSSRPACIGPGMAGVCQSNDAFDLARALTILSAITGNLEIPGGNLKCVPPTGKRSCYGADYLATNNLPPEQAKKKLGLDRYPLLEFIPIPSPPQVVWPAITDGKPYPVKALGLFANNSICAYPNSRRVAETFRSLEFLLAADYYHTPTTALADVILPPAHWTERDDVEDLLMKNHVFCQQKAIEPVGECRDEKQILIDLAQKIGLSGYWSTIEEILDDRLEPIGTSFADIKEKGFHATEIQYRSYAVHGRFKTPSGKVELYAEYLKALSISPLPVFREPAEGPVNSPDLWEAYPLVLTTGGRNIVFYHSSHRNIESLRKKAPDPLLQIHPETARQMDVADGEWVYLVSPRGRVEIKANYFDGLHPRVVHAPHGYWYGVEKGWQRVNINMITDDRSLCPVTASVPIKALVCRIEKMREGGS